jgi:phosphoenolpyruvate carboxylase
MEMSEEVREVLDTFRVAATLGSRSLGAYVISMAQVASDVLVVELLQREARLMASAFLFPPLSDSFSYSPSLSKVPCRTCADDALGGLQVAGELGVEPDHMQSLRVAPLFETLDDLDRAGKVMDRLLNVPIYRKHLELVHDNHQEVRGSPLRYLSCATCGACVNTGVSSPS